LGDLLFAIVNLIRRLNGNAEEVMRQETRKFSRRFREMEKILSETNQTMDNLDIDEMDALWEKVKRQENR
jgi:ATP diphosphatase